MFLGCWEWAQIGGDVGIFCGERFHIADFGISGFCSGHSVLTPRDHLRCPITSCPDQKPGRVDHREGSGPTMTRSLETSQGNEGVFSPNSPTNSSTFSFKLASIIKNQARTRGGPSFGDRPCDAALVRHAENHADFFRQNLLRNKLCTIRAFPASQRYLSSLNSAGYDYSTCFFLRFARLDLANFEFAGTRGNTARP
jgi:hypothetical protein